MNKINNNNFDSIMEADLYAVKVEALKLIKKNYKKLTKKQLNGLRILIHNVLDFYEARWIVETIKIFLKEDKENE